MSTPVWAWLHGSTEPVHAADIDHVSSGSRFSYRVSYLEADGACALDPRHLRLSARPASFSGDPGLPGVIEDVMPAGYGSDRLRSRYGADLTAMELLELAPGDAVGAIAVCHDIEAKLSWKPHSLDELKAQMDLLEDDEPSSRAIRRMNEDDGTSAGGDRPKVTVQADGCLWIAKLQDRGDTPQLPAREFTVMDMARDVEIDVPDVRLFRSGAHEAFLIRRFDRAGDPVLPFRSLFASAHTVLGLRGNPLPGDASRSYLVLADRMRQWIDDEHALKTDLAQLWRRMAYNALVGNKDDHTRNHGLLHDGTGWRLSPAYDITPLTTFARCLAMGVLPDGSQDCSPVHLLRVASRFGVELMEATAWLGDAANFVAGEWRLRMRNNGVTEATLLKLQPAFAIAEEIAEFPSMLEQAASEVEKGSSSRRRSASFNSRVRGPRS